MTLTEARRIAGSLAFPSKMPSTSYGLPVTACRAGAELAKQPGTVCSQCYAVADFYRLGNVRLGQARRFDAIEHPLWVEAMVRLLLATHSKPRIKVDLGEVGVRLQRTTGRKDARWRYNAPGWHRWHDSGDLQSVEHFAKIVEVCRQTPGIRHWLPTRELAIVRAYTGEIPANLTIRVSATMIDGAPPAGWSICSTVHSDEPLPTAHRCPAPKQDHQCLECRACWSRDVALVSYELH